MVDLLIGRVADYFAHQSVAGIELYDKLRCGDRIRILGHTTHLEMTIDSLQINRQDVDEASSGKLVGIRVPERVRAGDRVYKRSNPIS